MADDLKFVLVATGKEFAFTSLGESHFRALSAQFNRDKQKAGSLVTPSTTVRFLHFVFEPARETILVRDYFTPVRGVARPTTGPKRQWTDITKVTDGLSSFVTKSSPISIVDMYHAVRNAQPRASVIDFSIYSHGFVLGPAIANSTDTFKHNPNGTKNGLPIRSPVDVDGRVRTDFFSNMGEDPDTNGTALADFKAGFATGASLRVFGCDVQDPLEVDETTDLVVPPDQVGTRVLLREFAFQVIREAYSLQLKANTAIGRQIRKRQKPTDPVPLDLTNEFTIEASRKSERHLTHELPAGKPLTAPRLQKIHYSSDPAFFANIATGTPSVPYTEIIKFIARKIKETYIYQAAVALQPAVTCFGALPGTSGEFDHDGPDKRMSVKRDSILEFYEKFMGVPATEDAADRQRNYGVLNATSVAAVQDHLQNG